LPPPGLEGALVGSVVDALHLLDIPLPSLGHRQDSREQPAEPVGRPPPPPSPQDVALEQLAGLYPVAGTVGAPQRLDGGRVALGAYHGKVGLKWQVGAEGLPDLAGGFPPEVVSGVVRHGLPHLLPQELPHAQEESPEGAGRHQRRPGAARLYHPPRRLDREPPHGPLAHLDGSDAVDRPQPGLQILRVRVPEFHYRLPVYGAAAPDAHGSYHLELPLDRLHEGREGALRAHDRAHGREPPPGLDPGERQPHLQGARAR
jgi:hypothetical protein